MNYRLKSARRNKKLTQEQMAELLGYKSKSAYCMIEREVNRPTLRTALKIADVLGVPVQELFCDL